VSRDDARSEVYAAELSATAGTSLEVTRTLHELRAAATRITHSPWWPGVDVAVVAARADAHSSRARYREGRIEVRFGAGQKDMATLIHEMAHALAGLDAAHGALFRRAHIDIASAAVGAQAAKWVERAYRAARLDIAERCWPQPSAVGGRDEHGRFVV